jgi:hypothetical protein
MVTVVGVMTEISARALRVAREILYNSLEMMVVVVDAIHLGVVRVGAVLLHKDQRPLIALRLAVVVLEVGVVLSSH